MPNEQTQTSTSGGDLHRDPITGEPGAHPVGTGVGATAGGAAGAAIGAVGGPIGIAVGTAVGAIIGGLAGKGTAEAIDPTAEETYWREHHGDQPYADAERPYEIYAAAYRVGYSGYREGKTFAEREAELRMEYEGGSPRVEAGSIGEAGSATTPETTPGTMQNNMSTYPLRQDDAPGGTAPETTPGTMQNNMSTYPLRWHDAREAARAAYERPRKPVVG